MPRGKEGDGGSKEFRGEVTAPERVPLQVVGFLPATIAGCHSSRCVAPIVCRTPAADRWETRI